MRLFKILFFGTCDCEVTINASNQKEAKSIAYKLAVKNGMRANLSSCSVKEFKAVSHG